MKRNILYISYDGLTDTLGQSQILPYVIGLSKKSYQFTILSVEKKDRFEKYHALIDKICKENNIDWQYIFYTKKPPILSSIYDIQVLKQKARSLYQKKSFSLVHSRSYMGSIVALYLKRKYGTKFLFDMRGFYPDERVDGGTWNLKKWHYKKVYQYFKNKEKQFLLQADSIVSLTHAGKNIMQNDWRVNPPISVIPCATDIDFFRPIERPQKQVLTLGYLGSLGTWYMLPEMIAFYNVLLRNQPKARFLILTPDAPELVYAEAEKQKVSTENIEVRFAMRQELPSLLSQFDIAVFFIKPSFSKQASSPVKQGELMSMGIPVITNSGVGDTDEIIEQYKSGYLLKDFNNAAYFKAVEKIPEMLSWSKENLRKGAIEYFSLEKGVEQYASIYSKLLNA